ncbi:MAG TPA: hypothetical protein VMT69_15595, partial [Kineosporiaceae bacterium]|nr:hypothetical protein [Kineosporiaceae bacterium]
MSSRRDEPAPLLDRTFEAVVLTWGAATTADHPARDPRLGRRIRALGAAGIDVVVIGQDGMPGLPAVAGWASVPGHLMLCRLTGPHAGTGRHDVVHPGDDRDGCIDVRATEPVQAVSTASAWLRRHGIAPGGILMIAEAWGRPEGVAERECAQVVPPIADACLVSVGPRRGRAATGVTWLGGGRRTVRRLLDEQLRRRAERRVPIAADDPEWTIARSGSDPLHRRVTETLFTLGAGGLATRGSVEEAPAGSVPLVLAAGVYTGTGSEQQLLAGPDWTGLRLDPAPVEDRQVLDLRSGVLWREASAPGVGHDGLGVRTVRFASISRPGVVVLRAEGPADVLSPGPSLRPPPAAQMDDGRRGGRSWARTRAERRPGSEPPERRPGPEPAVASILAVASDRVHSHSGRRSVDRVALYSAGPDPRPPLEDQLALLDAAVDSGFDRLLADHRAAWADRWRVVDVSIPDDPAAQLAVRFALFQLWTNVGCTDQAAVGARGLSGAGYRGHVFWDADVYVLPAIASMAPALARAIIEYRIRRLPAARARARADGREGARFPWESADDGRDVTPASGYLGGQRVPILTGCMEEHVTADVAWAAHHYATWAGDSPFLSGPGGVLLTETARYWASRCRLDDGGAAHIDHVIGPDEYHERVDDNAFTNVMARWNLRRAADVVDAGGGPREDAWRWRDLADRLVDGYDPASGRYEQFARYDDLEALMISKIAHPPVAADVLLGRDRVAGSQVIKQPDVLMLHHLVPEEVAPGSLVPNLDFYGPRTAHGSSLSPAITAAVLARAGRAEEA